MNGLSALVDIGSPLLTRASHPADGLRGGSFFLSVSSAWWLPAVWRGGFRLFAVAAYCRAARFGAGFRGMSSVQMLPAGCRQVGCLERLEVRKDLPVGARSRVGVVR